VDSLGEQEGWRGDIRDRAKDSKILGNFDGYQKQRKTAKRAAVFAGPDCPQARISAAKPMSFAVNFGKNSENSDGGFAITMSRERRRGRLPPSLPDLTAAPSAD